MCHTVFQRLGTPPCAALILYFMEGLLAHPQTVNQGLKVGHKGTFGVCQWGGGKKLLFQIPLLFHNIV